MTFPYDYQEEVQELRYAVCAEVSVCINLSQAQKERADMRKLEGKQWDENVNHEPESKQWDKKVDHKPEREQWDETSTRT